MLNEKITKLRKEQGLSQEELGFALNVSRQAISKWESGQTKPDVNKLKELADYFGVSCDFLLNKDKKFIKQETPKSQKNHGKKLYLYFLQ